MASACGCAPVQVARSWRPAGPRAAPSCRPDRRAAAVRIPADVLPEAHRLRRPEQFRAVLRGRRADARVAAGRAGGALMTVHVARRPAAEGPREARLGLIVSTAVGNAVVRHRISRRLRHLVAARLADLPERTDLVIRAQPAAGAATSTQLGSELDELLARAASQARRSSR